VPVLSWLVLRGRCRCCGAPISIRYPAVELATGVLFGLTAFALAGSWAVPGMCALAATMLVLFADALDGVPPPAAVALVGTAIGGGLLAVAAALHGRWWHLGGVLIGVGAACVIVAVAAREAPVARAARRGRAGPVPLEPHPLPWALVPAGAAIGSTGATGVVVGVAAVVVVAFAVAALVRTTGRSASQVGALAVSVAALAGSGAAVMGALVAGGVVGA